MRDKDVRKAVRTYLTSLHIEDSSTHIVEEMGIWAGTVRIDMAVINGELTGYELKSDRDTLARLPLQADLYSRVFDRVTLVAGSRHYEKALPLIRDWWGVIRAVDGDGEVHLEPIREASKNPEPEPYLVAELLRRDEALAVLAEFDLAKGWRSKRVKSIHKRLAGELPFDILSDRVRAALKARKDWLGQNSSHQFNVAIDA